MFLFILLRKANHARYSRVTYKALFLWIKPGQQTGCLFNPKFNARLLQRNGEKSFTAFICYTVKLAQYGKGYSDHYILSHGSRVVG